MVVAQRSIGVGKLILVWIDFFDTLAETSGTRWIRQAIIANGKPCVEVTFDERLRSFRWMEAMYEEPRWKRGRLFAE